MVRRPGSFALASLALLGIAPGAVGDDREARRTPVVEVFEAARDAVVSISSTEIVTIRSGSAIDSFFDDLFDFPRRRRTRQEERHNVGSGFIIHPDGYLVTNAHVVARTTEQKVIFADGREYEANIVASNPGRDLAVLKIEASEPLPTLRLGRSNDLMVGETVIAIGNPFGYQHTVTSGVVSAVDREIAVARNLSFRGLIQTDASINPGNSGGPLLNVLGDLIGVNSAIRGDAQNIGFAIPVDQLREVLPDLLDVERRYRIDSGLAVDSLRQPLVTEVRPRSPAAKAGIRGGDVLREIDGIPIREGIDFHIALINRRPHERLHLTFERDGEPYRTTLQLAARPAPDGGQLAWDKLGLKVYPLPADIAGELGLRRSRGLLITSVEEGGPGDAAGLERRDVLLALGHRFVSTHDDLGELLDRVDAGTAIEILILRVEARRKTQRAGPIRVR